MGKQTKTHSNPAAKKVSKGGVQKKKEFTATFDAKGLFKIVGRAAFATAAKNIAVNQVAGVGTPVEDRRHVLHYDEVLKPNIERVMESLYRQHNGNLGKVVASVTKALGDRGIKRLPKKPEKVLERLVVEMNSATDNLIPDRADTNKAIEVVRGYVRKTVTALSTAEFGEDCMNDNPKRMAKYKQVAKEILVVGGSGSDISNERDRMHREILGFVNGCDAPVQLWQRLHEVTESVTFDFSPNITRDATKKTLGWQKQMSLNMDVEGEKQLTDLVSLI